MTLQEMIQNLCDRNVFVTVWKLRPDKYRCVAYVDLGYGDKIGVEAESVEKALQNVLKRLS